MTLPFSRSILPGIIIVLATLTAYWNIQHNSLIGYDDVKYLIENEPVRAGLSLAGIKWALTATYDANWFPVTWLSHMLDMSLFGSNPLGHHLENLLIHIGNALLIFTLLGRLTGSIWRSTLVALLFAVHPLHVESVAWAAERKDVLSTLFFLLTLHAYSSYTTVGRSRWHYYAALLFTVLGLATKPMLVSMPLVLLMLDYWPLGRIVSPMARSTRQLLLEKLPFALLALLSCIITYFVQQKGGTINSKTAPLLLEKFLYPLSNYATYLRKLLWPTDLAVMYPYVHPQPTWLLVWAVVLFALFSWAAYRGRQRAPYITMGWCWFVITTIPVAGFVHIGAHSVADRYTYIPSIGLCIAAAWLLGDLCQPRQYGTVIATTISMFLLGSLIYLTRIQTTYWRDSITLFNHAVTVTRDNWVAHSNLGGELLKYNRNQEALLHLQEAIRINPESHIAQYNLGVVLNKFGKPIAAIRAFSASAIANPAYGQAYFMAGRTSFEIGDRKSAYEILDALRPVDGALAEALERYYIILNNAISKEAH